MDHVSLDLVGKPDDSRLGYGGVTDQGRLDLRRSEPVSGDLDDVVHPSDDPDVSVLVDPGRVPCQVLSGIRGPVLLDVARGIL